MINIRFEEAINGKILRGPIGPNERRVAEVYSYEDPNWESRLNARLNELEDQFKDQIGDIISQLRDQIQSPIED